MTHPLRRALVPLCSVLVLAACSNGDGLEAVGTLE